MKFFFLMTFMFNANAQFLTEINLSEQGFSQSVIESNSIEDANEKLGSFLFNSKIFKCNWITTKIGGVASKQIDDGLKYCHPINFTTETKDIRQELIFKELEKKAAQNLSCGQSVKVFISAVNMLKGLDETEVQNLMTLYSNINLLLNSGAMDSVLTSVTAMIPDGTLITETDKAGIIEKINSCKAVF